MADIPVRDSRRKFRHSHRSGALLDDHQQLTYAHLLIRLVDEEKLCGRAQPCSVFHVDDFELAKVVLMVGLVGGRWKLCVVGRGIYGMPRKASFLSEIGERHLAIYPSNWIIVSKWSLAGCLCVARVLFQISVKAGCRCNVGCETRCCEMFPLIRQVAKWWQLGLSNGQLEWVPNLNL